MWMDFSVDFAEVLKRHFNRHFLKVNSFICNYVHLVQISII